MALVNDQPIRPDEPDDDDLVGPELARSLLAQLRGHRLLPMQEELTLARAMATGRPAQQRLQAEPNLPSAERRQLWRQVEAAADARQELVRHHVRLAHAIARRYAGPGFPLEDAQQEALIGLLRAADRFDPRRGYRFSSFATWWVRDTVRRAWLDRYRSVRLPESVREEMKQVDQVEQDLGQRLGRLPTLTELAAALGRPEAELERLLAARQEPLSLEATPDDDEELSLVERLADPTPEPIEQVAAEERQQEVWALLDQLPPRERLVLARRFDLDGQGERTLAEVGQELGTSRDRVRHLERQALRRLAALVAEDDDLSRW